jgi:hypothetical protein
MGEIFVVDVMASSRASPLPQCIEPSTKSLVNPILCGSGLARDEARQADTKLSAKKKPPPSLLRIGNAAGCTGAPCFTERYCAMVFTETPRSTGVDRP